MGVRTSLQLRADRRSRDLRRGLGVELRSNREDQGVSQRQLASAAGIDPSHLARIEAGAVAASVEVLERLAVALGGDLSVRFYPGTGTGLRDRFQAPIVERLLRDLHSAWTASPEVAVHRPARGVIDIVLWRCDRDEPLAVATEVQSQIRRLEQQLRWAQLKSESLPSAQLWPFLAADGEPTVSRLLVIRSSEATRAIARQHAATLAAAYPARTADAVTSLLTGGRWPGAAIVWADVVGSRVTIRASPPRGVVLGR
jgi:transcriptional regulator with XRE-family HTH domain